MELNEMRETMVQEWGLQDLPQEEQDATIEKIGEVLYRSIVLRATEGLTEAESAEFEKFAESKGENMNAAEALDWLRGKLPDFDQITKEETAKLKERITAFPEQ